MQSKNIQQLLAYLVAYPGASTIALSSLLLVQPDLEDMQELSDMRAELMEHVTLVMNSAADYRATFDAYSYLWTDDRHEFMRQFLLYNHVLTAEEIEAYAEDGMPESPPSLKQFRDQVS